MRYYTNGAGGHFNRHLLMTNEEIKRVIDIATCPDLFCSVQEYGSNGIEIKSQLVFDIDHVDMGHAYAVANQIADDVSCEYDTDVAIWFSGSKGFHVITGLVGHGEKANLAMKATAHKFSEEIDDSMYKTRSMFRLNNSKNGKSGLHKILVQDGELLSSVLNRAKTQQPYTLLALDEGNPVFLDDFNESLAVCNTVKAYDVTITEQDWMSSLVPCLKKILADGVGAGYRYDMAFMLVKHWRLCGLDVDEAITLTNDYAVFREAGSGTGYTEGMVRHYYQQERVIPIGCRSSVLSPLMQANCIADCPFNHEEEIHVANAFSKLL